MRTFHNFNPKLVHTEMEHQLSLYRSLRIPARFNEQAITLTTQGRAKLYRASETGLLLIEATNLTRNWI